MIIYYGVKLGKFSLKLIIKIHLLFTNVYLLSLIINRKLIN